MGLLNITGFLLSLAAAVVVVIVLAAGLAWCLFDTTRRSISPRSPSGENSDEL